MSTSNDMTTCPRCGHRNPSWYAACEKCDARLSLASSDFSQNQREVRSKPRVAETSKLPAMAHVMCGWPLILVAIGGAIGGALGAVAYVINLAIYKSRMPSIFKIILNLGVGFSAIAIWWIIVLAIRK
jgi:hypothetical protein